MEEKGLSPGLLLHKGWKLFKHNWLFLIVAFVIGYAIVLLPTFFQVWLQNPGALVLGICAIVNILLATYIKIGWIKISLKLAKGEPRSFLDLFRGFPLIFNLLVAELLVLIVTVVVPALVFLVVASPALFLIYFNGGEAANILGGDVLGVVVTIVSFVLAGVLSAVSLFNIVTRYFLVPYFVVDCYEGPIEAMKMSSRASEGVKWDLLALLFISMLVMALGFALFGVGIFVALPVLFIAYASAYYELIETTEWQQKIEQ